MNFITEEDIINKHIGVKGAERRRKFDENIELFLIGETIRQTRQEKMLTQGELGELLGVHKAQISRMENGQNLTISSVARIFKALGVKVNLEIGSRKVALW